MVSQYIHIHWRMCEHLFVFVRGHFWLAEILNLFFDGKGSHIIIYLPLSLAIATLLNRLAAGISLFKSCRDGTIFTGLGIQVDERQALRRCLAMRKAVIHHFGSSNRHLTKLRATRRFTPSMRTHAEELLSVLKRILVNEASISLLMQ